MRYAGIGNIVGRAWSAPSGSRGLASQNGTVGVQIRQVLRRSSTRGRRRALLLMHSDGITSRWSLDTYPGLLLRHPAVIAGVLRRDFGRGRDDATMVVVSRPLAGDSHV